MTALLAHRVHLEDALHHVGKLASLDEIQPFLKSTMDKFELQFCVYHARSLPNAVDANPLVVTTYPDRWVAHYVGEGFVYIDPVVIQAERSVVPVDWRDLDRSPVAVRRMFGEAQDFGVGAQGLTVCIRGPNQDRALFSVNSSLSDKDWLSMKPELLKEMQVFGHYLHKQVMTLHGPAPTSLPLSRREQECLALTTQGRSIKEIARDLKVSPPAVKAYLDSARHKLDAVNKTQAAVIATRRGLI
ncbi:MAG: helix-turn-helix transcriptional regulator [Bosea sp. (in: a-proteobacteria)]